MSELQAMDYIHILEQADADLRDEPEVYNNPYDEGDERHRVYEDCYKIAQLRYVRARVRKGELLENAA